MSWRDQTAKGMTGRQAARFARVASDKIFQGPHIGAMLARNGNDPAKLLKALRKEMDGLSPREIRKIESRVKTAAHKRAQGEGKKGK